MSSPNQFSSAGVKARAVELGFDLCGVAPACDLDELAMLPQWLARGYGGRMTYLNRTARVRADVRRWLPSARSVVVVANSYHTDRPHHVEMADPARARIARYAWGDDYHDVMGRRLAELAGWMRGEAGPLFDARWSVDDGPVQEKVYARRAGIGWIGRNTCVINHAIGSWILLGVLATNVFLEPDEAAVDRCGTCALCVEACPAGAFAEPGVLDARRCLSYLTIEIRGGIPDDQRPGVGAHIFGCDICQDVCPYNAGAPVATDACWRPRPELADARLARLWDMDDAELERAIEGTALRRAGVRGLRRNLAVAIGNAGPQLASALDLGPRASTRGDGRPSLQDPMVAEHISWARLRQP
ncbi:MAG: tRNA epoxyqueuosine(34) reductase QueG [Vicinamibacterales bacterium]